MLDKEAHPIDVVVPRSPIHPNIQVNVSYIAVFFAPARTQKRNQISTSSQQRPAHGVLE